MTAATILDALLVRRGSSSFNWRALLQLHALGILVLSIFQKLETTVTETVDILNKF